MTQRDEFSIQVPSTPADFEEVFDVRWRVLREAWAQPRGSERDALDDAPDAAVHVIARDAAGKVIGSGRGQMTGPDEAQVRYMAVLDTARNLGVGGAMLQDLETRLKARGAGRVMLNAREPAIEFYERHGYEQIGPAPTLYGVIKHTLMAKVL